MRNTEHQRWRSSGERTDSTFWNRRKKVDLPYFFLIFEKMTDLRWVSISISIDLGHDFDCDRLRPRPSKKKKLSPSISKGFRGNIRKVRVQQRGPVAKKARLRDRPPESSIYLDLNSQKSVIKSTSRSAKSVSVYNTAEYMSNLWLVLY